MQRNKTIKKPTSFKWLKWVFIIIGTIVIIFPLIRYIKKQLEKMKEQQTEFVKDHSYVENQNPITQQNKADKITVNKGIQTAAKNLAHHLGTKYSDKNSWWDWADPRGWTENDKEAADILLYQRHNYGLVKKLYFSVYTNSRNLTDDVLELLNDDELKRVQQKLKLT